MSLRQGLLPLCQSPWSVIWKGCLHPRLLGNSGRLSNVRSDPHAVGVVDPSEAGSREQNNQLAEIGTAAEARPTRSKAFPPDGPEQTWELPQTRGTA